MQKWKSAAVIVLLLAVIAAATAWLLHRQFRGPSEPAWFTEQQERQSIELIDAQTLETVTKPGGEWNKLGRRGGQWKNPTTGAYTMCQMTVCPACHKKIPVPPVDYGGNPTAEKVAAYDAVLADYACPLCKKPGILAPPRRPGRP